MAVLEAPSAAMQSFKLAKAEQGTFMRGSWIDLPLLAAASLQWRRPADFNHIRWCACNINGWKREKKTPEIYTKNPE